MSITPPTGILDITDAIVRVSKLEFRGATGFDTILNNVARNTILLVDQNVEYTTDKPWGLKLPNAWVSEFDAYWASGASGNIDFNIYNNTTSGTNGYVISMDDTTITVKYDGGSALKTVTLGSTLKNDTWRKIHILFERDMISLALDGTPVLYFKDTLLRPRVYDEESGYVIASGLSADRKVKNLKVVNGDKWITDGTSNIAYTHGNVGIGTTRAAHTLDVHGDIRATGNLLIEGLTTTVDTQNLSIEDAIVEIGRGNDGGTSGKDVGFLFTRNNGANTTNSNVALIYDESTDRLTFGYSDGSPTDSTLAINTSKSLDVVIPSGNLGIGTASPSSLLDVRDISNNETKLQLITKTSTLGTRTQSTIELRDATNSHGGWIQGFHDAYVNHGLQLGSYSLGSRDAAAITIRSANVGIGTDSPLQPLHVKGNGENPVIYMSDATNNRYSSGMGTHHIAGVGQRFDFYNGDSGANGTSLSSSHIRMSIDANGNVGIGTTNPRNKLHIYKATTDQLSGLFIEKPNGASGTAQVTFGVNDPSENPGVAKAGIFFERRSVNGRGDLKFCVDNTDDANDVGVADARMTIALTGDVGIGTASPIRKFDVRSGFGNSSAGWISGAFGGTGNYPRVVMGALNSVACIGAHNYDLGAWEKLYLNDPTHNVVVNVGNVGIGVASPSYPLHVAGNAGNMPAMKYFNSSSTTLASGVNDSITIYAAGNIYASGLIAASDERIKKNIVDADDAECLETLRLLKPKKYQYKDEINRGQEPVWGFIAQEVRDTLQYATHLGTNVVPNMYEVANVSQSNVITFVNFNTSNLEANAITIHVKTIHDKEERVTLAEVVDEHTIRVEEDLSKWTGSLDAEGNVITEITTTTLTPEEYEALEDKTGCVANISGYQNANVVISVEEYNGLEDTTGYEEVIENYTKTTTIYPGTQLFVYGQEVDDFVYIKKEAIWTVATSALQEVDRQLQAEKAKVATLETQLASVLARLDALENA